MQLLRHPRLYTGLLLLALPCWAAAQALAQAQAQATVKPDGQFRYAIGLGASYASGNTDASSVNLVGQAVRASAGSKLQFGGNALYGRSNGSTTAQNVSLGGNLQQDVTPLWYGFGQADYLRDKLANVSSRVSLFGGVGAHLVQRDTLTWDVSAGLGYTHDQYVNPADTHGALRTSYGRLEALLAEESVHKLTDTTTFRQKLSVYPALRSGGGYRGVFDSGLSVAMTPLLSLTIGLNYRYNSDPGQGLKTGDTLLLTGLAVKID